FGGELEPRIPLGQERIDVGPGPHPRRVPDLQVETTTLGKHGSEEQFPVKEALLVSDLLADTQPGVLDQDVGRFPGTSKRKVEFLSGAQFVPVRAGGEGGVAAAPG